MLTGCADNWAKDLSAHQDEAFLTPTGPHVRSAADFTYEVVHINRRLAARIRGDVLGPFTGFPTCPDDLKSREALATALRESVDEILEAVGDPEREINMPDGSIETPISLAVFAANHMYYHLGQLNLIQVSYGDTTFHWMD